MELASRLENNVMIIVVHGDRIDAACAIALKDQFRTTIDGHDGRVLMDMSEVKFMDSSGLGAMVAALKLLGGRKLGLCGLGVAVAKVFALTRMDQVFDLYPDLDAAMAQDAA